MQKEIKSCQNCKKDFTIETDDFSFYEKIKVPPPTFCPECRLQRRFSARNERTLYHRVCELCKKQIISMYSKDKSFPVYCHDCWWGDKWNPIDFRINYDFEKTFFSQFKKLLDKTPRPALIISNAKNCDYCNYFADGKACYLCFGSIDVENCLYGSPYESKYCVDTYLARESEYCYECIDCEKLSHSIFSQECSNSLDLVYCFDCKNCQDCIGCVGLRGQKYNIFNKTYTREEYLDKKDKLLLDTYINCPVQFYYKYIAGLSEADTIKTDYIRAERVGIFEHRVLKKFYEDFLTTKYFNKNCANSTNINMFANTNTDINKNRNTGANTNIYTNAEAGMEIHMKTDRAANDYFADNYIKEKINGIIDGCGNEADDFLVKETSKNLLFNFIKHDLSNNCLNKKGWEVLGLERKIEAEFNIGKDEANPAQINCGKTVKLFGILDRIDKFKNNGIGNNGNNENSDDNDNNDNSLDRGESYIIIDYKTGKHAVKPDIDKLNAHCGGKPLTDRSKIKEFIKSFQLPVYIYLFKQAVLNADNKKAAAQTRRNAAAGDYAKINACLGMVSNDIRAGKDKYRQYMFNADKENNDGAYIMENIIMPSLANIIKEISNEEKPFIPDYSDDIVCGYCSYSLLCGKIFN